MNLSTNNLDIAVIGLAGRFPLSENLEKYWNNLSNGSECIRFFSKKELLKSGIHSQLLNDPNYVFAKGIIDHIDAFDSDFFSYTAREAELMDPQQRLFLETSWHALENAGYIPEVNNRIGVFAGIGNNNYIQNILGNRELAKSVGNYQININNNNDFLSTRVAYKLNLKGPCMTIQSACSTSLLTVHLAVQSLLNGECDMALAGGVKLLKFPQYSGYLYIPGNIFSPDGHCRVFDAEAKGFVPGEGVGIIVLKRIQEAVQDNDHILAVIKGSSANNDGSDKIGFTAPSINGQIKVIKDAQNFAQVNPDSITYIEAHGTGTELGDPIELAALTEIFRQSTPEKQFCAIGSVKSNIGHLDTAAGIAGLIKTVLMLKHKKLVPSLHFNNPNPKIDFENSPFYVNTEFSEWKTNGFPRRAGVSSFGIGGTNVHIVLEEAPKSEPSSAGRQNKLIILSTKTNTALEKSDKDLLDYFKNNKKTDMGDVAYTLQVGRESFAYKHFFICSSMNQGISILSSKGNQNQYTSTIPGTRNIVFMFPGQGSQYINMGKGLYENEGEFRLIVDQCLLYIQSTDGYNIKEFLYPEDELAVNPEKIYETEIAQPLIFIIEYALANLLMKWGVKPYAMIGHSIGEYTAACLAGIMSLEEALYLVVKRGQLMQKMPSGAMLSVSISEKDLLPLLERNIALATVNSNKSCVVAGGHKDIEHFAQLLESKGYYIRKLQTSHAFHSPMMEPMLGEFESEVRKINLNKPDLPFVLNSSGKWATERDVTDAAYWSNHIRNPVRFADGINLFLAEKDILFVEVGPGRVLSALVKQQVDDQNYKILNLLRHPKEEISDDYYLLERIGQLWQYGVEINWNSFYENEKRNRVPLPTYPFERQKYWIEPSNSDSHFPVTVSTPEKKADIADWFYVPVWEQNLVPPDFLINDTTKYKWLIFSGENRLDSYFKLRLKDFGQSVIIVKTGKNYKRIDRQNFKMDPDSLEHYHQLFTELKESNEIPDKIIHLLNVTHDNMAEISVQTVNKVLNSGLYGLLNIAKSIGNTNIKNKIDIHIVTNNLFHITGEEKISPAKAAVLGPTKIIPLEYKNIDCKAIDITLPPKREKMNQNLIDALLHEFIDNDQDNLVAYRGGYRWKRKIQRIKLHPEKKDNDIFKTGGVYLITGGFGGMGSTFAKHFAKVYKAKLILVGRTKLPDRNEWPKVLQDKEFSDVIKNKIHFIKELENHGAKVIFQAADVADFEQMKALVASTEQKFGNVDGILHTAGLADYEGIIQNRTKRQTELILNPKVMGTIVLDKIFRNRKLDFFVLFSSLGNQLYDMKFGQVGYNAANEFLDAYVYYKKTLGETHWLTINWNDWSEVGMSVEAVLTKRNEKDISKLSDALQGALSPEEGMQVLTRSIESGFNHLIISTSEFSQLQKAVKQRFQEKITTKDSQHPNLKNNLKPRPGLSTTYVAPNNDIEEKLIDIYGNFFGYDKIGIDDNFYELGGDSLKAVILVSNIKNNLSVDLSIQQFLKSNTIKEIAEQLNDLSGISKVHSSFESDFIYFGQSEQNLFGVFYQPEIKNKFNKLGIVLCHPFAQEQISSYQAFVHLAQELARKGFFVLRFDFFGCGDSDGSLKDVEFDDWMKNIDTAKNEIYQRADIDDIFFIGLRLGATLAFLHSMNNQPEKVIMWHPIFDGKQYIHDLKRFQKKWINSSFASRQNKNSRYFETQGFRVSNNLRQQIENVNIYDLVHKNKSKVLIIDSEEAFTKHQMNTNKNVDMIACMDDKFWIKHTQYRAKKIVPVNEINSILEWVVNNAS